jgi:hypothetical protein
MGNNASQPNQFKVDIDEENIERVVNETATATSDAMEKDGAFRKYKALKLERDLVCGALKPGFSRASLDECVDLQMQTYKAQWAAINATKGGSLLMELFE